MLLEVEHHLLFELVHYQALSNDMQMVLKMDSLYVVIVENVFQHKQHIYVNNYVDEIHRNNEEEIFLLIQ